ncbi:outer membrane protein assembly factor BamB family protein [Roseimaritima ulvae]|uniref:Outer membrane biogenesis protein BamB n=1 Tax=Roseimaritima ulvae TaxID=980254 RepID=A0A5B9R7L5_9BACT|nr:PQQ-binding-like beta-propeller repeat protein [Roseimaritima ulvae]QEG42701.1 outer membrane biogenesis protein BamB [Roseimaritima ulvae]
MLRWIAPLALVAVAGFNAAAADVWPQWRGAGQDGYVQHSGLPLQWTEDEGIAWRIEPAGRGGSTPVHADGRIFLTSGVDGANHLVAYSAEDGKRLWEHEVGLERVSKHGKNHRKGSGANPSVVIDGQRVFAYFRSGDLASATPEGELQWHVNLQDRYGEDTLWWNLGTSPIVTPKAIVVAVMQSDNSYIVGLNKENGEELWKVERNLGAPEEAAQSYTTPLLLDVGGQSIIAVMGADHLTLHKAENGQMLAKLGGFNPAGERYFRSIASPVASDGIIVCPYARGKTLTGVNAEKLLAGAGQDAIEWFRDDLGADVPTPAARDGKVYVLRDKSGVACIDAKTGKTEWETELPRSRHSFTASPLVSDEYLYATQEDGTTFVIRLSDHELIQTNAAEDNDPFTVASLVPVGDDLLLRTPKQLVRISGK